MYQESPGGSDSKESSCNMGDLGLIPGLGRSPGGGHGNPLLYSCLENLQGQRGLAGYSPWGGKESDTTEWLSIHDILSSRVHQHIISLFSLKCFFTCFAIQPFPSSQLYKLINNLSEKAMAPHSSTLAWKIPWTEEPGRLQSMGSLSRTRQSDFTFTFHFHALEKEMATHSSVLAWRILGTAEPGGLPSMGSHRIGHD